MSQEECVFRCRHVVFSFQICLTFAFYYLMTNWQTSFLWVQLCFSVKSVCIRNVLFFFFNLHFCFKWVVFIRLKTTNSISKQIQFITITFMLAAQSLFLRAFFALLHFSRIYVCGCILSRRTQEEISVPSLYRVTHKQSAKRNCASLSFKRSSKSDILLSRLKANDVRTI